MAEESYLSINQVAIILRVHQLTVRRYIKEGRLKAVKLGGNIRVSQLALDNFTQDITPLSISLKRVTKSSEIDYFELSDPIFRLKARGLSLKPIG